MKPLPLLFRGGGALLDALSGRAAGLLGNFVVAHNSSEVAIGFMLRSHGSRLATGLIAGCLVSALADAATRRCCNNAPVPGAVDLNNFTGVWCYVFNVQALKPRPS